MINLPANSDEFVRKFGAVKEGELEIFNEIKSEVFKESIQWQKNIDTDMDIFPFKATVDSQIWKLRVNNFPDEPMYTLFINDKAILTFDDKPSTWIILES